MDKNSSKANIYFNLTYRSNCDQMINDKMINDQITYPRIKSYVQDKR